MTGAPPSGLRLAGLPDGSRAPRPGIEVIPGIRFPTHVAWEGPGANLSLVAARSAAINLSVNIAHRRARQQLRFDQGLVYDVAMDYEPLTPDQTHVMLSADCQEDRIAPVLDGLLGILRDLEATGPTDAELEAEMRSYVRQYDDRDGRIGLLAATAFDTLWGGETFTAEQFLDMRRAVGPAEAQAAMAAAMPSLLVLGNRPPIDGVPPYPMWSDMPIGGREHGPAGFFLPGRKPPERLWVASEGLTLAWDLSSYMTVRYADVVACVHHEPEVRTLLGRDGIRVTVDAKAWKGGAGIITEIDAAVPFELVACAEHGIGGLEDPVTEPRSPAAAGTSG
jgi:hypothetical protein